MQFKIIRSVVVKRDERVLVTHWSGAEEIIQGPQRVWLKTFDTVQPMQRVLLDDTMKILVTHDNGKREVVEGPQEYFLYPQPRETYTHMRKVTIEEDQTCYVVHEDGSEEEFSGGQTIHVRPHEDFTVVDKTIVQEGTSVVVVDEEGNRSIKTGPDGFFLGPRERLFEFAWTGGSKKEPRSLRFTILRTTPDQMYHDVEVRTKDQVILTMKLMVYWQVVDVEKVIHRCDDLIGAMINIISSAVATCFGALTFDAAVTETEKKIQDLEVFSESKKGLWEEYGVSIEEVRLRGWQCADPMIQRILDEKIQNRTEIDSKKEVSEAQHKLAMQQIEQEKVELEERGNLKELRVVQAANEAEEAGIKRGHELEELFGRLKNIAGDDADKALLLLSQELTRQTIQGARGTTILSGSGVGLNLNV